MIALRYQFRTDLLRLLQALIPSGLSSIDAFNSSTLQKFSIRQLKAIDHIVAKKEIKIGRTGMITIVTDKAKDKEEKEEEEAEADAIVSTGEDRFLPTKPNPLYLLAYGTMLMASRSYQSAIGAFLSSRSLPASLTSCAQSTSSERTTSSPRTRSSTSASVSGTSTAPCLAKRTTGSTRSPRCDHPSSSFRFDTDFSSPLAGPRIHGSVPQAQGTLPGSRVQLWSRVPPPRFVPFLLLRSPFANPSLGAGLQSYAVKHYEAALSLAVDDRLAWRSERMSLDNDDEDEDLDEPDDFARVTAYNLVNLYVLSGNPELARKVSRKWLAV